MPPRVLFVCHRVPFPPDKGDRIRSYRVLARLASFADVDVAFPADEPVPETTRNELSRLCRRVTWEPVEGPGRWLRAAAGFAVGRSVTEGLFRRRRLKHRIDEWIATTDYDAVVCFSSGVLPYVRKCPKSKLIADLVDVDSEKWRAYAERSRFPLSQLYARESRRVRELERNVGGARAVTFATSTESNAYRRIRADGNVLTVPNGVDAEFFRSRSEPAGDVRFAFVGYLDYRANVLGLEWFCRDVWPRVRERLPGATFQIVGRNAIPAVRRLERIAGVEVVGEVPDVRPFLESARAVVAPLPVARGVQNKVLEAMAVSRPVVATTAALDGLDVVSGRNVLRADALEEWSDALTLLVNDPGRARAIGGAAREYVLRHHEWQACLSPFETLVREAAEERRGTDRRPVAEPVPA